MKRLLSFGAVGAALLSVVSGASLAGTADAPWEPFFATPATVADFGATTRPFGVAAGDFDGDGKSDLVVGRTTGNVAFAKGNGDGTFAAPVAYAWKQAFFNAWAFAAGDVNGDGKLDVVWGASAVSSGCSVSPVPVGGCPSTVTVNDGDVRVWYGNGDGTFAENTYFVSGVRHNAGALLADVGTDAGSVAVGDIDGDGDRDVVAGAVDGVNSVVKLLRNDGAGVFTPSTLVSQATACATPCAPVYFPAISTQNSPWGLAFGDADGDGDADLWVGDRALYVYLYRNDGTGAFALQGSNSAVSGRPNVYLGHDSARAAVGFTPSLASADVNGDGKADLALGLHSGTQTPASGTPHDGEILLDLSGAAGHTGFGAVADVGTMARGVSAADVNGDATLDLLAAEYDGKVKLLRQLAPVDFDGDGVSDYVDNAPEHANAARLDMNTDGSITYRDQLDNDFDTVLGDPENPATWQRLGDPADADDDNDDVADTADNCVFVANSGQENVDADLFGDACDPLDNRDTDADGQPDGPLAGDTGYEQARAAAIRWSEGSTRFVIRIDALGRFFQNEFTQAMTDAAALSPTDWAAKCWENYGAGDPADPCGTAEGTAEQTLTLGGGKEVPVTLVTIPKQLWTDPPVVDWINDRNGSPRFDLGLHGTYHFNNVPLSDWAGLVDRNFFSCEPCGLSESESFELMRVGYDTLAGNYDNRWVAESGATAVSPKVDWSDAPYGLISFSPPFNASDTTARKATAQLGFKAFSASVFEEGEAGSIGPIFTPEGSHHELHDQWGMFHVSADLELEPPDTTGDTYDEAAYDAYLRSQTDEGGLTTWLIEEVEWSGRPCQNDDRLGLCNGGSNREDNTVYLPRWQGWLQLLDYVKSYPGGVVLTMAEAGLAKSYDNAPTVANPDQADGDHDGVGDAIAGASLTASPATLARNQPGTFSATLENAAGTALAGQTVVFFFDADGDGTAEEYEGTTNVDGVATAAVTATRAVGPAGYDASWDGLRATALASGDVNVADSTALTLDGANPSSGQVTDSVGVAVTLADSDGQPLAGETVAFAIGTATATAVTGADGRAAATLVLAGPAGASSLTASFAGAGAYAGSSAAAPFTVVHEDTSLALPDPVASKNVRAIARATLREADGAPVAGSTIEFLAEEKIKGKLVWKSFGTASTDATGVASLEVPARLATQGRRLRAVFAGDASFRNAQADAFVRRS